ncbi:MAG: response regulator [Chloroflexaceae bacterium]|nr:response regulator [Chloroflexaceae bacterium]
METYGRILVASSNFLRRELLLFQLDEACYVVREASDSTTLLEEVYTFVPDLIVLDVRLRGLETLPLVDHTCMVMLPIVFLADTSTDPLPALQSAVVLSKRLLWPYEPEDLLDHIHTLLYPLSEASPST